MNEMDLYNTSQIHVDCSLTHESDDQGHGSSVSVLENNYNNEYPTKMGLAGDHDITRPNSMYSTLSHKYLHIITNHIDVPANTSFDSPNMYHSEMWDSYEDRGHLVRRSTDKITFSSDCQAKISTPRDSYSPRCNGRFLV